MISILYNTVLLLGLPLFFLKIKHRLFEAAPICQKRSKGVILICAVSMGETKAASALFKQMKRFYPNGSIYVGCRTETGVKEAKKLMPEAEGHLLLPLDLSWKVRKFLTQVQPDIIVIIEGDFWYNFCLIAKKMGAFISIASGKLSEKSFRRFLACSFFSKKMFSLFDLVCVQNRVFQDRFISLGSQNVVIGGNLKYDAPFIVDQWESTAKQLNIKKQDQIIVLASTHDTEEKKLLEILMPLLFEFPLCKLLIVPRHPDRFNLVEKMLEKLEVDASVYSKVQGEKRVILIDAMGVLPKLYKMAFLSIVGGSFVSHIGGHNIFEPLQGGSPVLFGPYMFGQKDLRDLIINAGAGKQSSYENLAHDVRSLLKDQELYLTMKNKGIELVSELHGTAEKTLKMIDEKISVVIKSELC